MLEKMDVFFENRLSGYDEHMMLTVDGANEFIGTPSRCCRALRALRYSTWAAAQGWSWNTTSP